MNNAFVYMKVGAHAGETFEQIIAGRIKKYETPVRVFGGYGGNTCHPTKHVQPFMRRAKDEGFKKIKLLMQLIKSNGQSKPSPGRASSLSTGRTG